MSHIAVLGDVEKPITYSRDEAIGLMQEDGIVGAGGAGFPTRPGLVEGSDPETS